MRVIALRLPVVVPMRGAWAGRTRNWTWWGYTWRRLAGGRSKWVQLQVRLIFGYWRAGSGWAQW